MTLFNKRQIPTAEVYTIQEACEYLRCSYGVMRKTLERGDVPYRQVGKRFFIRRDALEEWTKGTDWKEGKGITG